MNRKQETEPAHANGSQPMKPSSDRAGGGTEQARDDLTRSMHITRITAKGRESCEDMLVREERFDLFLNGEHLVALVCLPTDLDAFIVGFLVNEGILESPYAVDFDVDREKGHVNAVGEFTTKAISDFRGKKTLTSGCGSGVTGLDLNEPSRCLKVDTDFHVRYETISTFMHVLNEEASLYKLTGGAHIAALADEQGKLLLTAQDIGRHTAVDKVIGRAILSGIDHERCVLFCSGRLSSEITAKAIHARTPVLVSRAAPTDLSVRLARRFLLTLVGFARGKRMNIYAVPERIID